MSRAAWLTGWEAAGTTIFIGNSFSPNLPPFCGWEGSLRAGQGRQFLQQHLRAVADPGLAELEMSSGQFLGRGSPAGTSPFPPRDVGSSPGSLECGGAQKPSPEHQPMAPAPPVHGGAALGHSRHLLTNKSILLISDPAQHQPASYFCWAGWTCWQCGWLCRPRRSADPAGGVQGMQPDAVAQHRAEAGLTQRAWPWSPLARGDMAGGDIGQAMAAGSAKPLRCVGGVVQG